MPLAGQTKGSHATHYVLYTQCYLGPLGGNATCSYVHTYVRTQPLTRLTEPGNANDVCYHYSSGSHPCTSTHWVVHHYRGIPVGVCLEWPAVYAPPFARLFGSSPIATRRVCARVLPSSYPKLATPQDRVYVCKHLLTWCLRSTN